MTDHHHGLIIADDMYGQLVDEVRTHMAEVLENTRRDVPLQMSGQTVGICADLLDGVLVKVNQSLSRGQVVQVTKREST